MARNGDGLTKRGRYWYFKYKDGQGQWREKATGKTSYNEAREARYAFLDKQRQGRLPTEMSEFTVEQALDHLLAFYEATGAKTSNAPYRTSCRHLKQIIGAKRTLKSVNIRDIQQYQITRANMSTGNGRTSAKTINNELLLLISVLKQARLWTVIEPDYRPLKPRKKGPGVALSPEQGLHLLSTALQRPEWFVALYATALAYSTGCRSYEIKALQHRDLQLDGATPLLRVRRETTKTDAGAREVALSAIGVRAATALVERARLLGSNEPDHYLLPGDCSKHTKAGDPLCGRRGFDPTVHQTSWSSAWESLKKAAGFPKLRFHDLRHTFITQGMEAGVPISVMKAHVGHVSAEMVDYYTHLGDGAKKRAVQAHERANSQITGLLNPTTLTEDRPNFKSG